MSQGWKTWATVAGSLASLALLATTLGGSFQSTEEGGWEFRFGQPTFTPWEDMNEAPEEQASPPPPPPEGRGFWLRLFSETGYVDATAIVSKPGVWPFSTLSSHPGGYLELPENQVPTLDGRTIQLYEVLVRSREDDEPALGFWGVIRGPAEPVAAADGHELRLRPAYDLVLEVVDGEGAPLEGAFVRVARESMALLNLHYTTREDGRANFRAIPPGEYFVTLDADGALRTTIRVEHGDSGVVVQVPMEDGRGLRMPFSWQGPSVQMMTGGSSSGGGSAGDGSGSPQEEAGEAGVGQVRVNVYAADDQGGGVQGAWIEAWAGGRRVAQGRSQGNRPQALQVPGGEPVTLVVTHAGWGEGMVEVRELREDQELIVPLSGELLSARAATDRVRRSDDIEEILEAPLVPDGRRWLVDRPTGSSVAMDAGLQRGDSLLFLRREGAGHRVLVERRNSLVEVRF